MPDNNEPDTPATLVGDEEHFPDNSKLITLLNERNEQLDHAENWIKTLQIKLDYQQQEYSDYCFKGEYEIQRLRHLLSSSEIQLREKREKIINLVLELDQIENQFRVHQITFNEIVRQRDGTLEKLGEISYLLEQEVLRNQINYETLKSVVLEREKLVKTLIAKQQKLVNYWKNLQKYKNFNQQYQKELKLRTENENLLTIRFQQLQNYYQKKKAQNQELTIQLEEKETAINHQNQIINELENEITDFQSQLETKQQTIWENEDYLTNSDEVLAHKNTQITTLNQQINQQTQIINQLSNQIKGLNEVIETQKEDITDLENLIDDKNLKNVNLTNENNTLQNWKDNHDCSANCALPHLPNCSHSDYDSLKTKLAEKESIIQQQAARIRELENKPPVVETKTVEKIKEVEKEKLVEKLTNTLQGESLEQIIEIDLNALEKELEIELSAEVKEQIQKLTITKS